MDIFLWLIRYYAIPTLCILISIVSLLLLIKRFHIQWSLKLKKKYRAIIRQFLIEIVINEYNKIEFKNKLNVFKESIPLHYRWCKTLVINEMIKLKLNVKSEQMVIISKLYKSLKLYKLSIQLIKDFRPYKKCIGFYHFMRMDYFKGKHLISHYLQSENDLIKSNANMAYIAITNLNEENLAFLPKNISKLNAIKIMDTIYSKKTEYSKSLNFLLYSNKISLIKISLQIRSYYNHRADTDKILQLLHHPSESIQIEALKTISKLHLFEAEDKLIEIISNHSKKFQINCYKCLANIGTSKTTDFISTTLFNIKDVDIQLAAIYCIFLINPTKAEQLVTANLELQKMLKHVKAIWK